MPTRYDWKGYTKDSEEVSGTVEAADLPEARATLSADGILVTDISEARKSLSEIEIHIGGNAPKLKDIAWVMRSLASTEQAGLPVFSAVAMLARQKKGTPIGDVLSDIQARVSEGSTLSQAFHEHEEVFGKTACTLIEVGETSGSLDKAFFQIANNFDAQLRLRRKVRSAMTYPIAVSGLCVLLTMALLIFVVPTFSSLYGDAGIELPLPTKFVVSMSNLIKDNILIGTVLIAALVFGWRRVNKEPGFRRRREEITFSLPLFGPLLQKVAIARFASSMAAVLTSGEGLIQALDLSGKASGSTVMDEAVQRVSEQVAGGVRLSSALRGEPLFGEMLAGLAQVGEETGRTDDLMSRFAVMAEDEVNTTVESLASLIEPLMIVVLGMMIGGIVVAIYLPMFSLTELVNSAG